MNPIGEAVARYNTLICVGSGGVGKTTVAASVALNAAIGGKGAMPLVGCTRRIRREASRTPVGPWRAPAR